MKNTKLSKGVRIMHVLCGIMLVFVLFKPIWRIELAAPQYPEGLVININAGGLGGDVNIINGLNHYIGMKTLHTEDFVEFKILPYLISIFAILFFLVGIVGNKKLMRVLFISFLLFGTIAMIDFWKWEYNYGHNLDPNAAIIVPGMAYQPPLIGYKQLLNFGAFSVPDLGGWLFIASGVLILFCIIIDFRAAKKKNRFGANLKRNGHLKLKKQIVVPTICLLLISITGCSTEPEPIQLGKDNCHYCKMTITDARYGSEIITTKGKVFKYDDSHCMFSDLSQEGIDKLTIKNYYFSEYCKEHNLIKAQNCFYLKGERFKAPMGGDIAVFPSIDSLLLYTKQLGGEQVTWNQLISSK